MKTTAIVVDIDNTLLSQNKRKQAILKSLFDIDISMSEIEQDFNLNSILLKIAKEKNMNWMRLKLDFLKNFLGKNLILRNILNA